MAKKQAGGRISDEVQPAFDAISKLVDDFCREHLNEKYAALCRQLTEKLARKRPSPLVSGKPNTWACGIIRTIGWVNFLDDSSQSFHMKLTTIDKVSGVGESTGQSKSKLIRTMLKIRQFDHHWTLPSRMDDKGRSGELWYVRRLPPLMPELATFHVLFTTPYILIESTKDDWMQFLKRTLLKADGNDDRERLHQLLKFGLSTNYWNEFVFQAYHHHQAQAIFLAGIPDLKATLPHA